jgi:hypothetical protein
MTKAGLTVGSSVSGAYAFASRAWGKTFAILFLAAAAQAAIFFAQHADIQHALALKIEAGGWLAALLTAPPAMGALYRVAVGGAALKDLGPGGLQWTKIEWSLIGVATLLFLSAVLFCIPATALAAVATVALRFGAGLGLQLAMQIGSFAFIAVMLAWVYTLLRLAAPASVAAREVKVFQTWPLTKGKALALAMSLIAAAVPLTALIAGGQTVLNGLETGDFVPWPTSRWPLEDAAGGGAALGLISGFLVPSVIAGLFGGAYQTLAGADDKVVELPAKAAKTKSGKAAAKGLVLGGETAPSAEIIPLPVRAEPEEGPLGMPLRDPAELVEEAGLLEHAMLLAPFHYGRDEGEPVREVELPSGLAHSATPPLNDTGAYVWRLPEADLQRQPAKGPEWEALIDALAPGLLPLHESRPAERLAPTDAPVAVKAPSAVEANDEARLDAPASAPVVAQAEAPAAPLMAPSEVEAPEPFLDHLIPAAARHLRVVTAESAPVMEPGHLGEPPLAKAPAPASEPTAPPESETAAPVVEAEPALPMDSTAPWPPLRIAAAVEAPGRPFRHPKLTLIKPLYALESALPAHANDFDPSSLRSGRSDARPSGGPASESPDP